MNPINESNRVEEFININTSNNVNQCHSCRRPETTDPTKFIGFSSQTAALNSEETMLKSLHRRLEIRIKRYLNQTKNTISLQEKLLNVEKCSQQELLLREKLRTSRTITQDQKHVSEEIKQTKEKNKLLEQKIRFLCSKVILPSEDQPHHITYRPLQIQQLEKDSDQHGTNELSQIHVQQPQAAKNALMQAEDRLHRMNLELSKICANNAELRTDIQHMLERRRQMIEEYNQLRLSMQNATDESRQLASECSDSYANRRDLVARMQAMRAQHERDEKKLLDDIRELDRLLESNYASKNFILNKSNLRQEQTRLNELFAGKRSRGAKSAYTADEFRRLFRHGFGQDFLNEKTLNRTVETFLDEQEQSFTLFEYAVELIDDIDRLREDLAEQRKHISDIFSDENINTLVINNIIATLEHSLDEASLNVQSLDVAKKNGRALLEKAYRLIDDFFRDLNADQPMLLSPVNDRTILLYLAAIESRVEQLLPLANIHRKGGRGGHGHNDDTTISWRIDHRHADPSSASLAQNGPGLQHHPSAKLDYIDAITPQIPSVDRHDAQMASLATDKLLPVDMIHLILHVYNSCAHVSTADRKHPMPSTGPADDTK